MTRKTALLALVAAAAATAPADTIRVGERLFENVYISSGSEMYYVMDPKDGSVTTVHKNSVAPEDLQLTVNDDARRALLDAWKARREGSAVRVEDGVAIQPEPEARPTVVLEDSRAAAQRVFERERLEDLVRFEAEYTIWREYAPEVRQAVMNSLVEQIAASQGSEALAQIAAQAARTEAELRLDLLSDEAQQHIDAIQQSRREQSEQVGRALTDSRYGYYNDFLDSLLFHRFWHWRPIHRDDDNDKGTGGSDATSRWHNSGSQNDATSSWHDPHRPIIVDPWWYGYSYLAARERARAAAKAEQIAAGHEAFRQTEQAQLNALNREAAGVAEQQRAAEREARRVASLARSRAQRANSRLERLMVFEAAGQSGYEPQVPMESLGLWEGASPRKTDTLTIEAPVWKMDVQAWGTGSVRVKVISAATGKPVDLLSWMQAPAWDFLVRDDPGQYWLEIDTTGAVTYSVEVLQVTNEQ